MIGSTTSNVQTTTPPGVVVSFYAYAALSFLVSLFMLLFSAETFTGHYFHPKILAITHSMALGWGTMIILGASHQLIPVLMETPLRSLLLAKLSFWFAAIGIPMLVYSFYYFQLDAIAITGAVFINIAVIFYLLNLALSAVKSTNQNLQALFAFTASLWLLLTTGIGFLLLLNFTQNLLPKDSLHYLSLHAHLGIAGWFLMMVMGVGSKLIPMFLLSKYQNEKLLKAIYMLINLGLLVFVIGFLFSISKWFNYLAPALIATALCCFGFFVRQVFKGRIRRKLDEPMKISMVSVFMMALPLLLIGVIIGIANFSTPHQKWILLYGFVLFFGWLTAIILGMTFKTLPFIIWNKVYGKIAGLGATPNPKDLYHQKLFNAMGVFYLLGFAVFGTGIMFINTLLLQLGAFSLCLAGIFYSINICLLLFHKPK